MKNKKKYYNGQWTLSNNRIFCYVLGGRGIGKTFRFKKYMLDKFLKKGRQFIYVRRYVIDIEKTANNYFDDILTTDEYKDLDFKFQGNTYFINGEVAGYAIAVSQFIKMKSVSFPLVDVIVFDEFITENCDYIGGNKNPYLEPELCLNFYQSVARGIDRPIREEVRFFFISNSVSINNPHFLYFNLDKKLVEGTKHILTDSISLEIADGKEIIDEIRNSQFGKLIQNSKYGDFALDNKFYLDSNEFITGDLPKNLKYIFTINYNEITLGVWKNERESLYYITEKYDPSCVVNYSLTNSAHKVNTVLIQQNKTRPSVKLLKLAYEQGQVFFQNQRCKNILITFLGL